MMFLAGLTVVNQKDQEKLRLIQQAVARVLTGTKRSDYITLILNNVIPYAGF